MALDSPRTRARLAGAFQGLEGLASGSGQVFIRGQLVVVGNAAATAGKFLSHERLFWAGFALSLIGVACHLAWAFLLHDLLQVVNRRLSKFALLVILVGCGLQAVAALLYLGPWIVLQKGDTLTAFTPEQLQALAYVFVRLNAQAFNLYLVFFGLWCVLVGALIYRSTFLPRILGALLAIDGLGWMLYIHPPLAYQLFNYIAWAAGIAEIPLQIWLLVFGLNEARWKEQAKAAGP